MSEFKGTRGKWELIEGNKDEFSKVKIGRRLLDLSTLGMPSTKYKEEIANAKLISCAPEMLEMLEETFKLTDKLQMPTEFEISQLRDKLFHLIKKATEL